MDRSIVATSPTSPHIIERNRRNAQRSTGPRTAAGKAVCRGNSLKHGLCANPASGVAEDREQFEQLHAAVIERFNPSDPVEVALVHRITVSIWRLQRAARVDAAVSGIGAAKVQDDAEEVQEWIRRINDGWRTESAKETESQLDERRNATGDWYSPAQWRVFRPYLHGMDAFRENTLMNSGSAIAAMMHMLTDLYDQLERYPQYFTGLQAEQLAWLLGESAHRLGDDHDGHIFPDTRPWRTRTDELIGVARQRELDEPMTLELRTQAELQLVQLRQQRDVVADPFSAEQYDRKRQAALLPDAKLLDRLVRYETHADRSLHRALETLAKLRGATVETMRATLTGRSADGATVEVEGTRTNCT